MALVPGPAGGRGSGTGSVGLTGLHPVRGGGVGVEEEEVWRGVGLSLMM